MAACLLETERRASRASVDELTVLFDGSKAASETRKRMQELGQDGVLRQFDTTRFHLGRQERYVAALTCVKRLCELRDIHGLTETEFRVLRSESVPDALPTDLHDLAFVPFLAAAADDDQAAEWVGLARDYRILGCYAQTELAHGSNVAGIETTARYVAERGVFVLHTPRDEARKWWPGNMARTATHAIVMAKLITPDGVDRGVHAFMVQLRDAKTHRPLPGITLGDIGPKMGMNAIDNGFLLFDQVEIPRTAMLARHAQVAPDGTYSPPAHPKAAYAGMISVRASLIRNAGAMLARAATIAVRYAIQRRQFNYADRAAPPQRETPILDYTMHQYRVLPQVATAYALAFTGQWMSELHDTLVARVADGDFGLLAEVHGAAAGLKSLTTSLAGDGIEALRKSCGGAGFSLSSGLPDLFTGYVGVETAEGENFLLTQQTARSLLKALQRAVGGEALQGTSMYLAGYADVSSETWSVTGPDGVFDLDALIAAYEHRAASLVIATAQELQAAIAGGASFADAWITRQVEAWRMSRAHSLLVVLRNFVGRVRAAAAEPNVSAGTAAVLGDMAALFGLYWVESLAGEFTEDGYMSGKQVGWVRRGVRTLLAKLRPDALVAVDAFNFCDYTLASAIGAKDGRVYERLIAATKVDPLNAEQDNGDPVAGYSSGIKPLLSRL